MSRLLLDTSVWIEILRDPASPQAARLARVGDDTDVILSSVVAAELAEGFQLAARPGRSRDLFARMSAAFAPRDFGFDAADAYGQIRVALRKQGTPIGPLDELIAAHAVALGAVVATLNVADFGRVAGLRVDDWRTATIRRSESPD